MQTARAALIAYWPFDENSGTVVADVSGNPNNHNGAFASGAETPAWVAGRLGSAVGFTWQSPNNPGSGRRVTVPFHSELQMNGPFTISYWYRMDAATPSGTFPGIMRIGTQGTGAGYGWGFFRTGNMTYKRGNNQPNVFPAMNVGQWYHLALRFDGNTTGSNNIAFLNGVQVPFATAGGWSNVTATTIFEMGRMDAFDQATLDDLALWNEAVAPAKVRSLYTVPASLGLDYNLADMRTLWSTFDAGAGGPTNTVKGLGWSYTTSFPGSTTQGDAYLNGGTLYLVLGAGAGVKAPLTQISGPFSPGGVGLPATLALAGAPMTFTNANLIFDLNASTTVGGGVNDLFDITGDLAIANSTITIDPLADLPGGTYRLINYSGSKSGSFTLVNNSRYTVAIDESTGGQINLTVSGAPANVQWASTSSGVWDLTSANWLNLDTLAADTFYQGDAVTLDDSGAFQTSISLSTAVFPKSITVNSSSRDYSITGSGQIGGTGNGLVKNGTSVLTLGTANTIMGDVQVNAGTVKLGSAAALGTTNGQTIIANGATVDLAGNAPGTESFTVQGAGVNGAGAIVNTGGGLSNNGIRGRITFLGDTTFGGVNRWDHFGGGLVGNGFKLTKTGAPEIALSNQGATGLGDIDIVQGQLTFLGNTTMGDPTKTLTIFPGATLAHWAPGSTILNKTVVVNSGNWVNNSSTIATNVGAVTLVNNGNFNPGNNSEIRLEGVVSGTGSLTKSGGGTVSLGGANDYSGRTFVNAGRLTLLASGSVSATPRIDVASGATFDVTRLSPGFTVASGQTLAGSGTVAGSVNVPSGASLGAGPENMPGTLTITNGLALSGGTVVVDVSSATTEGGGVNDLINIGGNLDLTGVSTIMVNPLGFLTMGSTYTIAKYTGTLTGTEAELTVSSSSHYTFSVSLATAGKITITVTGGEAADLLWVGGTPDAENIWDLITTPNWADSLGNPVGFYSGDKVLFDDFSLTNIVDLVGTLLPASIRVENGSMDYVFQGSGKISGSSSLSKSFDAKLTIANTAVNDYSGPTDIQGGTLQVGIGGTIGNLGAGTITNNGTLVYDRSDTLTFANRLEGAGNFVKQNTNTLILPTNNSNYSGGITINGGLARPTVAGGLGNATGGTSVAPGATLDVNGINHGAESVTAAGAGVGGVGGVINNGAGQNNALRFLTLSGDLTVGGVNRWDVRAAPTGSLMTGGNGYSLTKVGNNQFSLVDLDVDPALGDINVQAGVLSAELKTAAGDPTKTMTVASNATVMFWGRTVPWSKQTVLNGGRNIQVGNGDATMAGSITLNGRVTFEVGGTSLTINDVIGGAGSLVKFGGSPMTLLSDAAYTGGTVISNGVLQLGGGVNAAGSILGPVTIYAGALSVYRPDTVTLNNAISGPAGEIQVRTTNGLVLGAPISFGGTIRVGTTTPGLALIPAGASVNVGSFFLGDANGVVGYGIQEGGNILITNQFRVGHYPNNNSVYTMGGGTLTLLATPAGVVNQSGVAEQNGVIYLGIDGTGFFYQTGGVVRAHGVVLDARGNTAGEDTFTLYGGQAILGPSGFKTGSLDANTSYAINLGGGTITASANWTSVLRMTITGTNGNTTWDTANFTNTLTGILPGTGGLTKVGAGTLVLSGAATYSGGTIINEGTLAVRSPGALGSGSGTVLVQGGALIGDGTINDAVDVQAGGTLAPGFSIGKLTVDNTVTLGGTTVMEVSKSGAVITRDQVVSSSSITYGGTLAVVVSGSPLAAGDVLDLFDATSFVGSFSSISVPPLPVGLIWDFSKLNVDGTLRVAQPPPSLTVSYTGNTIDLSWPAGYGDYQLQAQTNAPGIGINSTNWVTLPDPGTNRIIFQVDQTAGSVFYRLSKP